MPLGAYRLNGLARYFVSGEVFDTITATGGEIEDVTIGGITYRVHKFFARDTVALTTYGSLVTTTTSAQFSGSSIAFDGVDDYIMCDQPVIPQSGDFTVETWVWVDTAGVRYDFLSQYAFPGEGRLGLYTNANKFEFFIGSSLGNVNLVATSTYAINTWYHVAAVRKDNKYYFYVDGVLQASDTAGKDISILQSQNTSIGRRNDAVNYLDGKMQEIRISNIARYDANFTKPTLYFFNDANTLLLIKGDRYAWTDDTAVRDDYYEGTTDYTFEITDMGNSNGVIEYLIVGGGGAGGSHDGIFRSPGGGGAGGVLQGQHTVSTGSYAVRVGHGGRGYPGRTQGGNGFDSSFHVFRAIGGGGGGYYNGVINPGNGGSGGGASTFETGIRPGALGISGQGNEGGDSGGTATAGGGGGGGASGAGQDGPATGTSTGGNGGAGVDLDFTGTSVGYAGGGGGSAYYATVGGIVSATATHGGGDGYAYYRGEDATEGTGGGGGAGNGGGYTTINGGYGASGVVAIRYPISSTNNIIDDNIEPSARTAKSCTAAGNVQVSTAQSKFGGASALFDGTGDKIIVGNGSNTGFSLGSRDFTIECWIRRDDTTTHRIFDTRIDSSTQKRPVLTAGGDANGQGLFYFLYGSNRISAANALPLTNTWYHVAVVRSNRWTKMYVNGIEVGTRYIDFFDYSDFDIDIGAEFNVSSTTDFDGYIDEFRVSNIARYTGPFTPPTAAFTNDIYTVALLHMNGTNGSTTFTDDNS